MYIPLNYEKINDMQGHIAPASVKYVNTSVFDFWCRSLFQRLTSVFDFTLPEDWGGNVTDFFKWCLFWRGHVAVFQTEEFGLVFQPGSPKGYDFYYQPTDMVIANPRYQATLQIGTDCEVIKLAPDWMGACDIVSYYAEKLATLDGAVNMSIINSKLAWIAGGRNKAAIESLKAITDKINRGEPTIYYDKALTNDRTDKDSPFQFQPVQDVRSNYILGDLLRDHQTIINQFCTEVGIPTIPYEKKERMTAYESNSKLADSQARVTTWLDSIRNGMEQVNALLGTQLAVELRDLEGWTEGGAEDGAGEIDADRDV